MSNLSTKGYFKLEFHYETTGFEHPELTIISEPCSRIGTRICSHMCIEQACRIMHLLQPRTRSESSMEMSSSGGAGFGAEGSREGSTLGNFFYNQGNP
jgi:hypothetical protein